MGRRSLNTLVNWREKLIWQEATEGNLQDSVRANYLKHEIGKLSLRIMRRSSQKEGLKDE